MRIKNKDTYICDLCGKKIDSYDNRGWKGARFIIQRWCLDKERADLCDACISLIKTKRIDNESHAGGSK